MRTCCIITAYFEGDLQKLVSKLKPGYLICADGGCELATSAGIIPDIVIGDADSGQMSGPPDGKTEFLRFPQEKDESDTFLCIKHAISLGFNEITVAGGIGGRLDHTISNIQTLAHFSGADRRISAIDENNFFTIIENSEIKLSKGDYSYISLFSLSDSCTGVTAEGLYYPLDEAVLRNDYPLGLSNRFTGDAVTVKVENGKLLIIMSKE